MSSEQLISHSWLRAIRKIFLALDKKIVTPFPSVWRNSPDKSSAIATIFFSTSSACLLFPRNFVLSPFLERNETPASHDQLHAPDLICSEFFRCTWQFQQTATEVSFQEEYQGQPRICARVRCMRSAKGQIASTVARVMYT